MASSVYAITKISSSSSSIRKTVWFMILVVGLIGSSYKCWRFFNFYFTYPIVVSLKVDQHKSLYFPAVSFCNFNRKKEIIRGNVSPYGTPLLMSERRSLFSCNDGRITNHDDNGLRKALMEYYGKSAANRYGMGYHPVQLMDKCEFDGKLCFINGTVVFQNFRYGNCFTFNARREDVRPLMSAKTGPGTGLKLEVSLHFSVYWRYTEAIGAKVVIHDPDAVPSPEDEGFNVSPGFETLISLKQTVYHRLPAPFKDKCVRYRTNERSSASNKNECIRMCIQMHNYATCGCTDQTLAVRKSLMPCNMLNDTDMCCLNEALDNLASLGPTCDCPLPCESIQYNEVLSKSLLLGEEGNSKRTRETVRLNVFYGSLEKTVYEQKPMFEGSEIFSFLGGELGWWLGLSVIAVFELVEKLPFLAKQAYEKDSLAKEMYFTRSQD